MSAKTYLKQGLTVCFATALLLTPSYQASAVEDDIHKIAREVLPTEALYELWAQSLTDREVARRFYNSLKDKHTFTPIKGDEDNMLVTYFAMGSKDTDYILQSGGPDFYGLRFKRLGNTDLFYCTQRVPKDAMFIYGYNEFKKRSFGKGGVIQTEEMDHIHDGALYAPDAPVSQHVEAQAGVPKGQLETITFKSTYMNEERRLHVYVPAGYDEAKPHNLIIQFDGRQYAAEANAGPLYRGWTPMTTILDNMIAGGEIVPTIAVLIPNQGNRSRDLISDAFAGFVARELVPWVKSKYTISDDTADVIVSGPSRGGFAAANIAFKHSDVIGGVLSQSGSYWLTEKGDKNWPVYPAYDGKLIKAFKASDKVPINFYLGVGLYELGAGMVGTNRELRDILELKGYSVTYREYKTGHSHVSWRHTLPDGLRALLGE
ncbi:alpha/beta hydrolase [Kordiimonas laminariae]|uniref:alpha/beta hydrolase n=1 Tax=Kordiimonas laminariae TaxID=2917717 RepID=UPI001FF3A56E|nr:alpha/beta hydrolase-fold protein [Kordiimonas laminariae]MCK0070213.1 hypothetical protein [Kordiimonas laminariae]